MRRYVQRIHENADTDEVGLWSATDAPPPTTTTHQYLGEVGLIWQRRTIPIDSSLQAAIVRSKVLAFRIVDSRLYRNPRKVFGLDR